MRDDVADVDGAQLEKLGNRLEILFAREIAAIVENGADDGAGLATGEASKIDGSVGNRRTHEHATLRGEHREDMSRHDDIIGPGPIGHGGGDGRTAITGRDAGGNTATGFDRGA